MKGSEFQKLINKVPDDYYFHKNIFQWLWHTRKLKVIMSFLNPADRLKILDVGTANGHIAEQLARNLPNSQVLGIDIYEKSIRRAKQINKKAKFMVADAENLPFKAKSFDLAVSSESLEHVMNPRKMLSEMKRVLTDDGKLLIEMDSGSSLFLVIWYIWTNYLKGKVWKGTHLTKFNASKLKRMLIASGFKIIKTRYAMWGMAVFYLAVKRK